MDLPEDIREQFRRHGRSGGRRRAERMAPGERSAATFQERGLPGGEVVDAGLADLASGRESVASLAVSLAAPRLRREGVPVGAVLDDPERRLFDLLSRTEGDLAHARYTAYLRRLASFADACRIARLDEDPGAT